MKNQDLEKQIKRLELAMDTCLDISQTDDRPILIEKLEILEKLEIIDKLGMDIWLAKYDSQIRDGSDIEERIAYRVFHTLFEPKEKDKTKFLWSNTNLGLSLMDLYNKKIHGTTTSFLAKHKPSDLFKPNFGIPSKKNSLFDIVLDLKKTGEKELDNVLLPNFLNAKKYFEESLKLLNENKDIPYRSELIDCLTSSISQTGSRYQNWLQEYNKRKKAIKETFTINKQLTHQECEGIYKDLKDLEFGIYEQPYNHSKRDISGARLSAIQDYCLKFIKILKEKKSPKFNDIISNLYIRSSAFKKKKASYLKKALEFDKTNLEAHYQLAGYNEERNNESQALMHWSNLVKFYFEKRDKVPLGRLRRASNEVGRIEDKNLTPDYMFEKILVKRSKNSLSKEYSLMKQLYDLSSDKSRVPKPVAYIKNKEGYNYLVMRETTTGWGKKCDEVRSLSELLDYISDLKSDESAIEKLGIASKKEILDRFKAQHLKITLRNLIKFQEDSKSLKLKEEKYDIKSVLENKVFDRMGIDRDRTEPFKFLVEQIEHQETCFSHGDFHSGNILIKGYNCTLIDFEYAGVMPLLYDAVFLVEDPELDLDERIKEELVGYYLQQKGICLNDTWKKNIDYMSLFVTLRWAGISSKWMNITNEENYNRFKLINLKKSEKIIDKMLTYTSDFESSNLQKLKTCLKELY